MKFRTQFDDNSQFVTNPGTPIIDTFALRTDDKGVKDLVKVGKLNIYEQIQSHADSVDLHLTLERFLNGDISALDQRHDGVFMDLTTMPQDFYEVYQKVEQAEELFYDLPVEVREKFNHSPSEFFAEIGTEKWNTIITEYNKPVQAKEVEKEVVADEK